MKNKVKRTPEQRKELNSKIAEIIWYSIGGIVLIGGFVFSILGLLIMNMRNNFTTHPFYPLYEAQGRFFSWLGFGSTYANAGLMLILVAVVYLIIVFYIFSNIADVKEKRNKNKKIQKKSLKIVIEENVNESVVEQ